MGALLPLLNVLLPNLIALYKVEREAHPDQPAMDDAFFIDLLASDSQAIVDKAAAWNAAHPPTL